MHKLRKDKTKLLKIKYKNNDFEKLVSGKKDFKDISRTKL